MVGDPDPRLVHPHRRGRHPLPVVLQRSPGAGLPSCLRAVAWCSPGLVGNHRPMGSGASQPRPRAVAVSAALCPAAGAADARRPRPPYGPPSAPGALCQPGGGRLGGSGAARAADSLAHTYQPGYRRSQPVLHGLQKPHGPGPPGPDLPARRRPLRSPGKPPHAPVPGGRARPGTALPRHPWQPHLVGGSRRWDPLCPCAPGASPGLPPPPETRLGGNRPRRTPGARRHRLVTGESRSSAHPSWPLPAPPRPS